MLNNRATLSERMLRQLISGIVSNQNKSHETNLHEIAPLVAAGLALVGAGAGISAAKENLMSPDATWIKGLDVCKRKNEFDTTLGASTSKLMNIKLSKYQMPEYGFNRQVNFEEERARAEAPMMILVNRAFSLSTEDGDAVLLYTASGSIERATKEFNTRTCRPAELLPGGAVYEKLKAAYGNDQANFKRQLAIAAIDNDDKLRKSSTFNGSRHYYVISKCNNDYLRSEIDEFKNSQYSNSALIDWVKKLVTIDRTLWNPTGIGDVIEKLPPQEQQWIVDNYNKVSSIFGLAGFIHPIFATGTIGMNIVLGLYYQRIKPDETAFGVKLSTINFVSAGLCAFVGTTQATIFAKQTSDISIMTKQFADIRNINGLPALGVTPNGIQSTEFTLKHLRTFCQLFPEFSNASGWSKVANGWSYTLENGKILASASGKSVVFSDDVKSFIQFYMTKPTVISQYIEWYQGMPGTLTKIMITGGAALDSLTIAGLFDTPAGENAVNETKSVTIDIDATDTKKITTAILKQGITPKEIKLFYDKTPLGSVSVVNQQTKESKIIPIDFYQNDLSYVIENMLNKSSNYGFNPEQAKVFIVDEELYDNFDLFIEYPELFDKSYKHPGEKSNKTNTAKSIDTRSTIAYKISQFVYILLTTSSARELAALKRTIPYNEKIIFYNNLKDKLNNIQELNKSIASITYLINSQPQEFNSLNNLPNSYRLQNSKEEIKFISNKFPLYTQETSMTSFPDAILNSEFYNQHLEQQAIELEKQLQDLKSYQAKISDLYKTAYAQKMKLQLKSTPGARDFSRGPKY